MKEIDKLEELEHRMDNVESLLETAVGMAVKDFEPDVMIKQTNDGYILKDSEGEHVFENDDTIPYSPDIEMSAYKLLNFLCYNTFVGQTGSKHSPKRMFIELRDNDDEAHKKLMELLKDEKLVEKVVEITDGLQV